VSECDLIIDASFSICAVVVLKDAELLETETEDDIMSGIKALETEIWSLIVVLSPAKAMDVKSSIVRNIIKRI